MKKRWILIALLVGALTIGVTAGTVLAQGGENDTTSPFKSFASRVASILGLDEAKVEEAMTQAAREMQDEALQKKLDNMVAQGRMTQEQADELKQWYESRPEGVFPCPPFGKAGPFGGFMRSGRGWHGGMGYKWGTPQVAPTPGTTTN